MVQRSIMVRVRYCKSQHTRALLIATALILLMNLMYSRKELTSYKRTWDIFKRFTNNTSEGTSDFCPEEPPNLVGPIEVDKTLTIGAVEETENLLYDKITEGGWYRPTECLSRNRVAIIVPFRDRFSHLEIFLRHMHPFLIKQQIEYAIFIVEQTSAKEFNKAAMMNVGYLEASKMFDWDCFIFHDIDLLPLNDRNLYTCPEQPRHMSVAIDKLNFTLPYRRLFGGVAALTKTQFETVNGFSNSFWGWGGEDDDMSFRLINARYNITRYPTNIARYTMLRHTPWKKNVKRRDVLIKGKGRYNIDGINSIKYKIVEMKKLKLFTWFLVELKASKGSINKSKVITPPAG